MHQPRTTLVCGIAAWVCTSTRQLAHKWDGGPATGHKCTNFRVLVHTRSVISLTSAVLSWCTSTQIGFLFSFSFPVFEVLFLYPYVYTYDSNINNNLYLKYTYYQMLTYCVTLKFILLKTNNKNVTPTFFTLFFPQLKIYHARMRRIRCNWQFMR